MCVERGGGGRRGALTDSLKISVLICHSASVLEGDCRCDSLSLYVSFSLLSR